MLKLEVIKIKRLRTSLIFLIGFSVYILALPAQAQQSDPQKLLLDSINFDKIDVSGVRAALDRGANPNWVSETKRKFSVIGHLAMVGPWSKVEKAEEKSVEILQMLFRAGGKLQPCDRWTLFFPIAEGWTVFTEVLLKNGANPTSPIEGQTPMEIAVKYGRTNIIELLRKHGVPVLEHGAAAQLSLIGAASDNDISRMEEAIRNGADVNGKNRQGETALIKVMSQLLFTSENYGTIQFLLKKGADPTIKAEVYGVKTTVLHLAIERSSFVFGKEIKNPLLKDSPVIARLIIESLLRYGALISAQDGFGLTPLHVAAKYNNLVGAKILIEAGSKIMPRDNQGRTPLHYAESAEMIKLLKDHGAKEE